MKSWQFRSLSFGTQAKKDVLKLIVVAGKQKGKIGIFKYAYGSRITLQFEDVGNIDINYAQIEFMHPDGTPDIVPVTDMTGRPITIGSYICFSRSSSMHIGIVKDISKIGELKVKSVVVNGETPDKNKWSSEEQLDTITDPFRSLILPVDDTTLITWVLRDFKNMKETII